MFGKANTSGEAKETSNILKIIKVPLVSSLLTWTSLNRFLVKRFQMSQKPSKFSIVYMIGCGKS